MKRLFAIAVIFFTSVATAQTLRIQILDGRTGKPIAQEHVNLFRNGTVGADGLNRNGWGYTTDNKGLLTIPTVAPDTKSVAVYVDWHHPCSKVIAWFPVNKVLSDGVVSENTCKPKLESSPVPGTLIFFVRDETFFEKMAR
jgi:hypothetical protein